MKSVSVAAIYNPCFFPRRAMTSSKAGIYSFYHPMFTLTFSNSDEPYPATGDLYLTDNELLILDTFSHIDDATRSCSIIVHMVSVNFPLSPP
jgi:hypothetical protein